MFFIDLQNAYDSVDRELLLLRVVLAHFDVQAKMFAVFGEFHDGLRTRVCTDDGEHSKWFNIAIKRQYDIIGIKLAELLSEWQLPLSTNARRAHQSSTRRLSYTVRGGIEAGGQMKCQRTGDGAFE